MENLKLAYDVCEKGLRFETFLIFPAIAFFSGISIFLYSYYKADRNEQVTFGITKRLQGLILGPFMSLFALLFIMVSINPNSYYYAKSKYSSDEMKTVEGRVENYHPMPEGGHDMEKFDVNGAHFEFTDYAIGNYGYNNAASLGGVFKPNLYVKLKYYTAENKDNIILRIETE